MVKPYQVPLRCVAYALQKPFEEELEQLQKEDIIAPLGMDEISEWCNSFVLVPKGNKAESSTDKTCAQRANTYNILPILSNAEYLSVIDWVLVFIT